jgi:hypothetical protein
MTAVTQNAHCKQEAAKRRAISLLRPVQKLNESLSTPTFAASFAYSVTPGTLQLRANVNQAIRRKQGKPVGIASLIVVLSRQDWFGLRYPDSRRSFVSFATLMYVPWKDCQVYSFLDCVNARWTGECPAPGTRPNVYCIIELEALADFRRTKFVG